MPDNAQRAARLVVEIGSRGDSFARVFDGFAAQLAARGLKMPSFDDLPDAVAPYALAFGSQIVIDPETNEMDMEASADALDAKMIDTFGTSPRQVRAVQLENEIRRRVADQTAEAMRRNGLTPLRDMPADDGDE